MCVRGHITKQYVNLGCGTRYDPDWINIDIVRSGPDVLAYDLSRGIPLPDTSCDVVYHSHVLEHIRRPDALSFMKECYRILKPLGIMRVVVPDLEQICRVYLEKLGVALTGDPDGSCDYEWIMLEMYDQTVREQSGGGMTAYLDQDPLPNEGFIYERIGEEGRNLIRSLRFQPVESRTMCDLSQRTWYARPKKLSRYLPRLLGLVRYRLLARLFLGADGLRALKIGRFRLHGEVHQWMYDRYSLARLMLAVGFRDPIQQSARASQIPEWSSFNLDTRPDGIVNKPDSIFMEAIKPV